MRMSSREWLELAKLLPSLLWVLLAAAIIWNLWPHIKRDLIPHLSGFKAFGVELSFARVQLDQAASQRGVQVSMNARSKVLRRASLTAQVLVGMRVVWVDDKPENNLNEMQLLNSVGIFVDQVRSTDELFARLGRVKYDAVISDIARGDETDAGIRMAAEMWNRHLYNWTIFYVTRFDPSQGAPPRAFGITNRPDHLLHYLIDIAERERL
jgi:hypothetical protein